MRLCRAHWRGPAPDLTPRSSQFSSFSSCRWYTIPPPRWPTFSPPLTPRPRSPYIPVLVEFNSTASADSSSSYWLRDQGNRVLAPIHRWTGMDGVRTAEWGEGVTGAMIRARIRLDGRLAGGLQALWGVTMAAYSGCGERDGGIGHGKRRSRTGLARVCGDVGLAGGSVAEGRRQAGSGMARSRARARLNCSSHGQRLGRCRVIRRAERVSRPARAKNRRRRVLVVTIC